MEHEKRHHEKMSSDHWKKNSSRMRADLGAPKDSRPWTGTVSPRQVPRAASRQRDLIDIAWEWRLKKADGSRQHLTEDFWCDVSMTVARSPWAQGLLPFRSRGHLYSFEANRCLSGRDCLLLVGWPPAFLEGARQGDLLTLAQESSIVPTMTLIIALLWANPFGEWNSCKEMPGAEQPA